MLGRNLWLAGLLVVGGNAKTTSDSSTTSVSTLSSASAPEFTGSEYSYSSVTGQVTASDLYGSTVSETSSSSSSTSSCASGSTCSASKTTDTSSITTTSKGSTSVVSLLVGGIGVVTETIINGTVTLSSNHNSTATSSTSTGTSTSATATNTQACNGYTEFCDRSYGNITQVCAHNSAFVDKGSIAANQIFGVETQLDNGIRMIQGETHFVNDTIYMCHTSCDLLNVGPWVNELKTIKTWMEANPYDVVTLLIVNSDFIDVTNYVGPLEDAGLTDYLYEPPYIPMKLSQWPTLSEMILSGKRLVVFMDYEADQTEVPFILDEFTQMWETPFSPTNVSFPCTIQRPPGLNETIAAEDYLYLVNHNLNAEIDLLGLDILIPNTASLNITNSAGHQLQELGANAGNCTADWGRPPNWLLVDYYNVGDGSVFEVAAKANGVTYNQKCCGTTTSSAAAVSRRSALLLVAAVLVASVAFVM